MSDEEAMDIFNLEDAPKQQEIRPNTTPESVTSTEASHTPLPAK